MYWAQVRNRFLKILLFQNVYNYIHVVAKFILQEKYVEASLYRKMIPCLYVSEAFIMLGFFAKVNVCHV